MFLVYNITQLSHFIIHAYKSKIYVLSYVVMPNHIHLIVSIDRNAVHVETSQCGVSTTPSTRNETMQNIANHCGQLSHVISRFKSAITRFANIYALSFVWQTRFHDHIIRDRDEMNRIAQYVENNVPSWKTDRFNKTTSSDK